MVLPVADDLALPAPALRVLASDDLFVAFGGGVGKFGCNFAWFSLGNTVVWVDVGAGFPDANTPGLQKVLPDLRLLNFRAPTAIILTHGHEDHVGALVYIVNLVPDGTLVYASPYTIALVQGRLKEHSIPDTKFEFVVVEKNTQFDVGRFSVHTFFMPHSIPQTFSVGLHDTMHDYKLYFTSDFKTQGKEPRFNSKDIRRFGPVDYLFIDSTGSLHSGLTEPEQTIIDNLEKAIRDWPGRIFITTFSSHMQRVRAFFDIARKHGRKVGLQGYSLKAHLRAGYASGEFDTPPHQLSDPSPRDEKGLWLVAGCQAEEGSSLFKLAHGLLNRFQLNDKDLLIYSGSMIPGNEQNIFESLNLIAEKGVKILGITSQQGRFHTSGHGRQDDILQLIEWVQPKHIVPVHGDLLHFNAFKDILQSKKIKASLEIARQGNIYHLGYQFKNAAPIQHKPAFIDGLEIHHNEGLYHERQAIGQYGVCLLLANGLSGQVELLKYFGTGSQSFVQEHEDDILKEIQIVLNGVSDRAGPPIKRIHQRINDIHKSILGKTPFVILHFT